MENDGFTEKQKEELLELFGEMIKQAQSGSCGCRISPEMKQEMAHVEQSVRAIGEGKLDRGVERMRANHEMMTQFRLTKKDTFKAVVRWTGIAFAGFVAWSLWRGFAAKIGITGGGGM